MATSHPLCCIPARGGSKRLPRKNLLALAGRPLIAWSIEAARESGCFEEVYVCTEDEEIAEAAERHGARVPELAPADLCGDLVPSHRPCQWLAGRLREGGQEHDLLVCLQPTSPLRSAQDIRDGLAEQARSGASFVASVTPVDPHYFHWAVVPRDEGGWGMYFGSRFLRERPLLPPVYRPNGSIKIARLAALAEVGHFFGAGLSVIETPEERSVHVATRLDLELCEAVLRREAA